MKKLILAAAIAAVTANTATAATVYDDKGLTFKIKGDWQVQLRDNASKTKDTEVEFDDLEVKNSVTYDLGNGLKAFGQLDFGFKNEAEQKNTDNLEEAYLGLEAHNVSVLIGKTDNAAYDFGVEQMIEDSTGKDIFDAVGRVDGDDLIRLDADFDVARVAISHELEAEGEGSADGQSTEIYVEANFDMVTLGAAYQANEENSADDTQDIWGLSAVVDAGFAEFGVDFGESDSDDADEAADFLNVAATFKASKTTKISVGYAELDFDDAGEADIEQTYVNVTYKFPAQKNVRLFAEISDVDEEGKDLDMDILAGIRIKF
jgi:predicted porin